LPVDPAVAEAHPGLAERVGQPVIVGIRPEALDDTSVEPEVPGDRVLEATVDLVESLGAELMVHVAVTGVGGVGRADGGEPGEPGGPGGDPEHWTMVAGRGGRAVARLSTRSRVRPGDAIKLAVDPSGLHLFDSTSGASLRTTET
jgi:multiple sugar transport system ATP-binding protein